MRLGEIGILSIKLVGDLESSVRVDGDIWSRGYYLGWRRNMTGLDHNEDEVKRLQETLGEKEQEVTELKAKVEDLNQKLSSK